MMAVAWEGSCPTHSYRFINCRQVQVQLALREIPFLRMPQIVHKIRYRIKRLYGLPLGFP